MSASAAPISGADAPARAPIRPLPSLLINQIAAGEVVERPASAVKELLENALDAGATRIRVELEQGGVELLRIADDGCGIPSDQLPLAIASHATSKIRDVHDLDRIATLGFRGEALASIASVSRLELRSRTAGQPAGAVIRVEGDRVTPPEPAPGPVGTSIAVRNLFFNTPARRKFLKTPATEQARCLDVVRDAALGNPSVAFFASVDSRPVLDLPPGQSPRERAIAVLGRELEPELIEVHADRFDDARGLALWGLIGRPSIARATIQAQHVFLNGRVIRDKTIQHAIREAFRGLIEPGRHPTAVLMLEMDPGAVDVNVHPAKTEVRFRDSSMVHATVFRAIREALRAHDLTPMVFGVGAKRGGGASPSGVGPTGILPATGSAPYTHHHDPRPVADRYRSFIESFQRPVPGQSAGFNYQAMKSALDAGATPADRSPASASSAPIAPTPPGLDIAPPLVAQPRPAERVLQVHKSYLVTQDEQGVVIIDQHALHERVMFEALMARVMGAEGSVPMDRPASGNNSATNSAASTGSLESQRLLTPFVVRLPVGQIDRLGDLESLLARIGVEARPLGPDSLGVHAFPTFLFERGVEPQEFLGDLFDRAGDERFAPGSEEALHEVLDMMACKAAVKAGDQLSDAELEELVRLRTEIERSSNCPHGRPTSVRLTIRELERLFKRG